MASRNVAVLGATGSIGVAAIDVIQKMGEPWALHAVSAHQKIDTLQQITLKSLPKCVVLSGGTDASGPHPFFAETGSNEKRLRENEPDDRWPSGIRYLAGPEGLVAVACDPEVDIVVAAIVGRAGVESTLAALAAGKRVALANKETLVCAGPIVAELLAGSSGCTDGVGRPLAGDKLLPVDSEHSAIFQCLAAGPGNPRRLILTASGGPFREWSLAEMREATIEQALRHPTWKMGRKISIDSATMMNKALEIIEAKWLFDVPARDLEVVIHPQSIVHSMVEFVDGSIVAQMSPPDMRLPIQYALTYPERTICPAPLLERTKPWELSFHPVDPERFPAIPLGFEVAAAGGTAGSVINAANEAAVDLFLNGQIRFTDIVQACRSVLEHHTFEARPSIERLLELDRWARAEVRRWSCRAI